MAKLSQNLTQLSGQPQMVKQGDAEESIASFEAVKGRYKCLQEQGKRLNFLSELSLLFVVTFPALFPSSSHIPPLDTFCLAKRPLGGDSNPSFCDCGSCLNYNLIVYILILYISLITLLSYYYSPGHGAAQHCCILHKHGCHIQSFSDTQSILPKTSGKSKSLTFTVPQFPHFITLLPLREGTEDFSVK